MVYYPRVSAHKIYVTSFNFRLNDSFKSPIYTLPWQVGEFCQRCNGFSKEDLRTQHKRFTCIASENAKTSTPVLNNDLSNIFWCIPKVETAKLTSIVSQKDHMIFFILHVSFKVLLSAVNMHAFITQRNNIEATAVAEFCVLQFYCISSLEC